MERYLGLDVHDASCTLAVHASSCTPAANLTGTTQSGQEHRHLARAGDA
jgi:hypothetical protein